MNLEKIALLIKSKRNEKKLTQQELADKIDVKDLKKATKKVLKRDLRTT